MVKLIWVLGTSLSISFLCSILEAVLLSITHSYVGVLKDRGERAGHLLARMQERIDEPIAAILTLNTIAHTVGAAMGGAIALDFALRYPYRLAGLILVGSGARLRVAPAILTGILSDFEATVDLVCDYAFGPNATERLKHLGRQRLLKTPPEVLHGDYTACDVFDVMERLEEVRCPTLVIGGTADRLTPPKYSIYLRDHIPGAELVLVDAAGHMVMLEKPDVVAKAVSKFILVKS